MHSETSQQSRDPLVDVLASLNVHCQQSAGLVAGGRWAVAVAPYEGLKFNAIVRGEAWLRVDGEDDVRLGPGDCFLLAGGRSFIIASDLALPPAPAAQVFASASDGYARIGAAEDVTILAGRMGVDPAFAPFLVTSLPPVTVVKAGSPLAESMHWMLQRLARETAGDAPASQVIADRMIEIMFVELLRAAISVPGKARGWLAALADRRIARVLHAMHADPARPWTLQELAGLAHMSRSAFAEAFRGLLGMAPFQYLQRWRLHVAGHALRNKGASVSAAAELAGYSSDSAFINAFRRLFGSTPARYASAQPGQEPASDVVPPPGRSQERPGHRTTARP